MVLDGQQRLQSLFIGLLGSYDGKELYLDVFSGDLAAPDDVRYKFSFLEPTRSKFPWVKFKDLIFTSKKKRREVLDSLTASAGRELNSAELNKMTDHVDTA